MSNDSGTKMNAEMERLRRRAELAQRALEVQSGKVRLQHRNLRSMIAANSMLVADQPTDVILKTILGAALTMLGAKGGSIMLRDEKANTLAIWASEGLGEEYGRHSRQRVGEGIAGRVAQTGEPVLLTGEVDDPDFHVLCVRSNVKDAVVAPLKVNGKTIGVLNLRNSNGSGTFDEADLDLLQAFADQVAIAIEVARRKQDVENMYVDSVSALAGAVDARDTYTGGHSALVREWSLKLARRMGLDDGRLSELSMGALLHDVGKIGVEDAILRKPGPLTDEEYSQVKMHPILGARILAPLGSRHDIMAMVRHHHERYDGTGYPAGLKGEDIPVEARILSVADSYHAMTSARPYRDALPREVVVKELRKGRGTQFDPHIVDLLLECLDEECRGGDQEPEIEVVTAPVAGTVRSLPVSGSWMSADTLADAIGRVCERIFSGLEALVGAAMARDLEQQVNLRAAAEGCSMAVVEGRIVNDPSRETVQEMLENFEELFDLFREVVGRAIGVHLLSGLIDDALVRAAPGNGTSFERFFLDRVGWRSSSGPSGWRDISDLKAG
jgi:HD-GYP domain-containing protein (c-di-GMP phosphodiesterase class II)